MPLVTANEVRLILEVPGDVTDASLNSFIQTADLIVAENLGSNGYSAARLKNIELYLAAHFALVLTERGGLVSSKLGDSQDNYTSLTPMGNAKITGFQLTRYGQQALLLDTKGTLLALSKSSLPAQFRVISTTEENNAAEVCIEDIP